MRKIENQNVETTTWIDTFIMALWFAAVDLVTKVGPID